MHYNLSSPYSAANVYGMNASDILNTVTGTLAFHKGNASQSCLQNVSSHHHVNANQELMNSCANTLIGAIILFLGHPT